MNYYDIRLLLLAIGPLKRKRNFLIVEDTKHHRMELKSFLFLFLSLPLLSHFLVLNCQLLALVDPIFFVQFFPQVSS
jgi:hypothetical protein